MALYAFDGTWNRRDGKEVIDTVQAPRYGPDRFFRRDTVETNVHRLYGSSGRRTPNILKASGPLSLARRILRGRVRPGRQAADSEDVPTARDSVLVGDHHIDIVGFSRGAALALPASHT